MRYRSLMMAVSAACGVFCGMAGEASAQGNQGNGTLPFANTTRRASLSPYTALGFQGNNPQTGGTLGAMQGLVRPQQQQQSQMQQQARQARQLGQIQNQVRQIQRPGAQQSIDMIRPTGHASTYMNMSHFYPTLGR